MMNNRFKKIISSLVLALMVFLVPVEAFAQEKTNVVEITKQEFREDNQRSSRTKRSAKITKEDRKSADEYAGGCNGNILNFAKTPESNTIYHFYYYEP